MTGELERFRLLADQDLLDAVARLERTVRDLHEACGEVGLRVRLTYQEQLDRARAELARRAAA